MEVLQYMLLLLLFCHNAIFSTYTAFISGMKFTGRRRGITRSRVIYTRRSFYDVFYLFIFVFDFSLIVSHSLYNITQLTTELLMTLVVVDYIGTRSRIKRVRGREGGWIIGVGKMTR